MSSQLSPYSVVSAGTPHTTSYRVFLRDKHGPISPFHDIPLHANVYSTTEFHMVVEIPRWTNAKMEIFKEEKLNPFKQDVKNGKLRYVDNVFPYHGYIWNYGALPQTWEDPHHVDEATGCKGDNDPIDVCEIGSQIHPLGAVIRVKALGVLALVDEGETDWKIMAIDVSDPLAPHLNDIEDIEKLMPGYLDATRRWFKVYKMPQGKPPNNFAFNGEFKNKDYALKVIEQTHKHWQSLIGNHSENGNTRCENTQVAGSPYLISLEAAEACVQQAKQALAGDNHLCKPNDTWHFVRE